MNSSLCSGNIVEALNANVYGNGTETLVLSHGFGTDQSAWHYIVPYLALYFKVVVFDLVFATNVDPKLYDPKKYSDYNGYAQDLVCVLEKLKVKNAIYMGHSMSAMIGCIASTKRPQLFQHLILLAGSPRYLNAKGYYGGFKRKQLNEIFNQISQNYTSWVQDFAPIAVGVNNTKEINEFKTSLGKLKPNIAASVAKTIFLSDYRHNLSQFHVPSTIIQPSKDAIVPKNVAFYLKKKLGAPAKVKILKTEGHLPQLTAYPLLLKVLKKVLIKG